MKSCRLLFLSLLWLIAVVPAHAQSTKSTDVLYRELAAKDSLLFDIAFNSCKVADLRAILSADFTFFHDNGYDGLTMGQSGVKFLENVERFCANRENRMRREIEKGSLQVFAIGENDAVQTGVQRLYLTLKNQPERLVEISKFTRSWRKMKGDWKMIQETDFQVKTHFDDPGQRYIPAPYIPAREPLYATILQMDSLYFDTYNTCNLQRMATMLADTIEFYHDRTGLCNSKAEVIANTKKNICGRVTRELVPGSVEVYTIPGYGALEIGYHRFHNNLEPVGTPSRASKFITLWKQEGDQWKMARVISLH
ncbi:MAG: nuclear transport factor 2 family protein [Chitinophaga sp.]|uniref:nuclear transport factor 2 family protein n=1 Tax=Chitinophaga sp. TaxID=1869181 RepID=UPI001B2A8B83|nr:nuclear transport factor 2 family protein [Chitinophaga sp.]MBO9730878.1 nuclear transport factor 2 family protein [Chitinophaga sp.]